MEAGLVYENMKSSEDSSSRRRRRSGNLVVQEADRRLCPHWHWHWIVLWLSCAGNVLLIVAVILIGVHDLGCSSSTALNRSSQYLEEMTGISNTHQCTHKTNSQNKQAFRSHLRQYLCEATDTFTENRSCNLCPRTWLLYEEKCYWFSTSILPWTQSHRDCVTKRSQLLVISNTGEQEFIQDLIKNKDTWIGFRFKLPEERWMWVNGSPLNQRLSQPLTADCGIIGKKGIASDMCSTELHWICQKPSVFI